MEKYLSISIILAFGLTLGACDSNNAKVNDNQTTKTATSTDNKSDYSNISGNYQGKSVGYGGDIDVDVTIEDGVIKNIVANESETDAVGVQAIDKLNDRVIRQNTTDLDTISGATISSAAYLSAINKALESAGIVASNLVRAESEEDIKTSYDTDVVVGAGGAGLSSAIELAQNNKRYWL